MVLYLPIACHNPKHGENLGGYVYDRLANIVSIRFPCTVLTYVVSLRDRERHVKRMRQMVLRVQRRRATVRRCRVHGLLLAGGHGRVAGGV